MTPEQIKDFRIREGYSLGDLAALLGLKSDRLVRRWEDGSAPISGPAERLLYLLVECRDAFRILTDAILDNVVSSPYDQARTGQAAGRPSAMT